MDDGTQFVVSAMKKIEMEPDDVIVIETPHRLSAGDAKRALEVVGKTFGAGVRALVLDGGTSLSVLRRKS